MARHPQSDHQAARASELLSDPRSSLGGTLEHARMLLRVQHLLSESVEPSLVEQFRVANIRQNRLILLAPSAAWATRLRLETSALLGTLRRAGFAELRDVEIRVTPPIEQPAGARSRKPLSTAAEQALSCMARLGAESEE